MFKASVSAALAFVLVAAISYWMADEIEMPINDRESGFTVALVDDPCGRVEHLQETINEKIETSKACKTDQDCTAIHLGCPFGCRTTVNLKHVDELQALKELIPESCPTCLYVCVPQEYVIECQLGLCQSVAQPNNQFPNQPPNRPFKSAAARPRTH